MSTAAQRAREVSRAVKRFEAATSKGAGPAGAPVRLTINDDDPASTVGFDRVFDGLGVTLAGLEVVLGSPEVIGAIREQFARNFDQEGGRTRWPQLAPSTVAERVRLGYGGAHPILQRTGALRRHVLGAPPRVSRSGSGAELRIRPDDSVGGVPKYLALAMGTHRMPGRPMVVIDASGAVKVTSAISRALRSRAAASGLR